MFRLKSWHVGLLVVVILFGGILATSAFGWWQTESTRTPERYAQGDLAGQYRPDDIRGSYTFGDISALFDIPLADLVYAFALPPEVDAAQFQCKDLESMYASLAEQGQEIGTSSVRLFVALYRGLPIELEEDAFFPAQAVVLLKMKAALTAEQIDYLDAHSVLLDASAPQEAPQLLVETPVAPAETEHAEGSERMIKGSTTFREVLDWGVPQAVIERVIGAPLPNPLTVIRDYCASQGLSYGVIKAALQVEVDAAGQ